MVEGEYYKIKWYEVCEKEKEYRGYKGEYCKSGGTCNIGASAYANEFCTASRDCSIAVAQTHHRLDAE